MLLSKEVKKLTCFMYQAQIHIQYLNRFQILYISISWGRGRFRGGKGFKKTPGSGIMKNKWLRNTAFTHTHTHTSPEI